MARFTLLFRGSLLLFLLSLSVVAVAQQSPAATSANRAPTDHPALVAGSDAAASLRRYDALIASAVKKARQTLPQARKRFQAGLAPGEIFFLTTRIFDPDGTYEQVFVRVREWQKGTVKGTIANELNLVALYTQGQLIEFPEKAVLDWTITQADGSEDGNFVGKFIDSLQD